jgi:hypothetical protein
MLGHLASRQGTTDDDPVALSLTLFERRGVVASRLPAGFPPGVMGYCHRRRGPEMAVAALGKANMFAALVELMGDALVGRFVGAGVLAAEAHLWSRRPGGGWLVEVIPLRADDFCDPEGGER